MAVVGEQMSSADFADRPYNETTGVLVAVLAFHYRHGTNNHLHSMYRHIFPMNKNLMRVKILILDESTCKTAKQVCNIWRIRGT